MFSHMSYVIFVQRICWHICSSAFRRASLMQWKIFLQNKILLHFREHKHMYVQHKYYFFSTRLFDRRRFSSKDCFTGQSPGTMLAIYIPAAPGCAEERAKSKPVSLGGGWKSGVVGGAGDLSEDLTDGRGVAFEVVAAR